MHVKGRFTKLSCGLNKNEDCFKRRERKRGKMRVTRGTTIREDEGITEYIFMYNFYKLTFLLIKNQRT